MMTMTDEMNVAVSGTEAVAALKASGALDGVLAQIDAGSVQIDGKDGLIQELIKAVLGRGVQAELAAHVGYGKGDADASAYENSRNGTFPKTLATSVGKVAIDVPRDRLGTFTPTLVPKGQRRLGGLDEMIISLYAGGLAGRPGTG
jgi:putative transposase